MVNKLSKNALEKLILEINSLDEVKRFKRLDAIISSDEKLRKQVDELHEVSKQMTHAKAFELPNAYEEYRFKYVELLKSFEDNVLLQMYLETSEEVKGILSVVTKDIERIIYNKINE